MTRDLSIKEVAHRLALSVDYVRRNIDAFRDAYQVGTRWRIPEDSVDRFRADRQRETRKARS